VALIAVAALLAYRGVRKKFIEDLDLTGASPTTHTVAIRLGQAGYPALGVAYGIIGALIVTMAATYRPDTAVGLDAALTTLAAQPHGSALLLLVPPDWPASASTASSTPATAAAEVSTPSAHQRAPTTTFAATPSRPGESLFRRWTLRARARDHAPSPGGDQGSTTWGFGRAATICRAAASRSPVGPIADGCPAAGRRGLRLPGGRQVGCG